MQKLATCFIVMLVVVLSLIYTVLPVHAALMEYTYTGPILENYLDEGLGITDVGNAVTVQFKYDGVIPVDTYVTITGAVLSTWSEYWGPVEISSPNISTAWVYVPKDGAGVPTRWKFSGSVSPFFFTNPEDEYSISTGYSPDSPGTDDALDYVLYGMGGGGVQEWTTTINGPHGEWKVEEVGPAVPIPPTVLLLASGLIPLAWYRRRKL